MQEKLAGATLMVFCNKQDVAGALTPAEIKDVLELDLIENRHWSIVPCSAVTGSGLLEGIDFIVHDIQQRIYMTKKSTKAATSEAVRSTVVGSGTTLVITKGAVTAVGLTSTGPVSGGAFAAMQAAGSVTAGSLPAALQSFAMGGLAGGPVGAALSVGLCIAVYKLLPRPKL